ncbi:MAG: class I SAM-dependent methyltransferase [Burkholderiales bacterium]|nr:class I SAM-dependent methyltransferase [Burkholderiales bacterium]
MANCNSRTDRDLSVVADEFVWDGEGASEANGFILPAVQRMLALSKARSVLDLGCGNGYCSGFLHEKGYEIAGCDFSKSGIDLAQRQFPGVNFFQQDLSQELHVEHVGKYDAVISTEVIEHLLLPRKLMENAISALRPGGMLIISAPYHGYLKNLALALTDGFDEHWHPLRDYGHVKFFSRKTIVRLFEEFGFKDIRFETVGRIPAFARSMLISGTRP